MKILLIDNYDSFTYNLLHLIESVGGGASARIDIMKNDEVTAAKAKGYSHVIISPGAGLPSTSGNLNSVISGAGGTIPILGICLGHQAVAEVYGAKLINMQEPCHGIRSKVDIDRECPIFAGLPRTIYVGRYHSWSVDETTVSGAIEVCARSEDGYVMAIRHRNNKTYGVQFHPESHMTTCGATIISNFLKVR